MAAESNEHSPEFKASASRGGRLFDVCTTCNQKLASVDLELLGGSGENQPRNALDNDDPRGPMDPMSHT